MSEERQSQEHRSDSRQPALRMLPNCVLLGAQKAGSTFLHRCLGEHPDVFMPGREIDSFEDPHYREDALDRLASILKKGSGKRIVAIKRPDYLARPECPPRIARHCPSARLVVILRNPLDRAVSAYFHYVNYGFLPLRGAEEGIRAILEGRYASSFPAGGDILEYGFYHKHLSRYLELYRREQLHLCFHDDLARDSLAMVQGVYRFLEIDDSYAPRELGSRPMAVVYSLPRLRVRRLRNPLIYTYDEARVRIHRKRPGPLGRVVHRTVRALDNRVLKHVFTNRKPKLSPDLMSRLQELYRDDIEQLEKLSGRDLSGWKA